MTTTTHEYLSHRQLACRLAMPRTVRARWLHTGLLPNPESVKSPIDGRAIVFLFPVPELPALEAQIKCLKNGARALRRG